MRRLFLATIFIMSNRSVSTKALTVLPLAKKAPGTSLKIKFVIFKPWKVLWNKIDYYYISYCYIRLILKKVLKKRTQIQLSRGTIQESKKSWRVHFSRFFKIQNFGKHGATSRIYWIYYKFVVFSYSEVGTYVFSEWWYLF